MHAKIAVKVFLTREETQDYPSQGGVSGVRTFLYARREEITAWLENHDAVPAIVEVYDDGGTLLDTWNEQGTAAVKIERKARK